MGISDPETHHQNRYASLLDGLVKNGVRWLDIGAGTKIHDGWTGISQEALCGRAQRFAGCDVHFEHLNHNPFITERVGASVYSLPFADATWDLLTANMVLEHLETPSAAFAEISRILAPGGAFAFVTPHVRNPIIGVASIVLRPEVRRLVAHKVEQRELEHIFPTYYRANARSQLTALGDENGLAVELLDTFYTWPFLSQYPGLREVESLSVKLLQVVSGNRLGTNIIGVLRKKA